MTEATQALSIMDAFDDVDASQIIIEKKAKAELKQ